MQNVQKLHKKWVLHLNVTPSQQTVYTHCIYKSPQCIYNKKKRIYNTKHTLTLFTTKNIHAIGFLCIFAKTKKENVPQEKN